MYMHVWMPMAKFSIHAWGCSDTEAGTGGGGTQQREGNSLMMTARMTRIMTMRMIHSFTFCHHSFLLRRVAVRWNMSAFWFRYSARRGQGGGGEDKHTDV